MVRSRKGVDYKCQKTPHTLISDIKKHKDSKISECFFLYLIKFDLLRIIDKKTLKLSFITSLNYTFTNTGTTKNLDFFLYHSKQNLFQNTLDMF